MAVTQIRSHSQGVATVLRKAVQKNDMHGYSSG